MITRHESPGHAHSDRGADPAGRRRLLPEEYDRLRARAQSVRREGVSAAVRAGLCDLRRATSSAARRFRTCATSGGTPSSSTGACRKPSTPRTRSRWNSRAVLMAASPRRCPRVLTSTTSHKREPLLPTLEFFGALGLRDLDLNLHHILEAGVAGRRPWPRPRHAHDLRVWVAVRRLVRFLRSRRPRSSDTFASVARQVALARRLGVRQLRLFFGRLESERLFARGARDGHATNLRRLSDRSSGRAVFVFENHDGASLRSGGLPGDSRDAWTRPNVRMNFDPINFAKAGVDPMAAPDVRAAARRPRPPEGPRARRVPVNSAKATSTLAPVLRSLAEGAYAGALHGRIRGPGGRNAAPVPERQAGQDRRRRPVLMSATLYDVPTGTGDFSRLPVERLALNRLPRIVGYASHGVQQCEQPRSTTSSRSSRRRSLSQSAAQVEPVLAQVADLLVPDRARKQVPVRVDEARRRQRRARQRRLAGLVVLRRSAPDSDLPGNLTGCSAEPFFSRWSSTARRISTCWLFDRLQPTLSK